METITFDQIPASLVELHKKIDILLSERGMEPEQDKLLTVDEYREYYFLRFGARPARQTVYDLVFYRKIPFEKFGKYLYFRKSKIDEWFNNGRKNLK